MSELYQNKLSTTMDNREFYGVERDKVRIYPHPGQYKALNSQARFIVVLAGTQGGKTVMGPWWLYSEIARRGPGDYMVVTPSYKLLNLKALPEFKNVFERLLGLGTYKAADKVFEFDALGELRVWGEEQDQPTRILFGYATDPDSLESATAKAAWLDEAGQSKFKLDSFDAIMRRLSLAQGRVLITTTPYNLGWLKQKFWDKRHSDPEIDVIQFDSTKNPSFPKSEYERAERELPRWKFDMFYRAIFTRPAGMIYDCFDNAVHKVKRFVIPYYWKRYLGLDFGGVNTHGVFVAAEPDSNRVFVYREYRGGGMTAKQHVTKLLDGELVTPLAYGGAKSEQQWRNEFGAGGLFVGEPPISEVEVGIDRVYGGFKNKELFVFDDLNGLLDEIGSYSRELDDMGEPTEKIANKETYHKLDALRYIMSHLRNDGDYVVAVTYA